VNGEKNQLRGNLGKYRNFGPLRERLNVSIYVNIWCMSFYKGTINSSEN
jgi:hypothetical protein